MSGAVAVRGAEAHDLPAIVEIEKATFSRPWTRETFASVLERAEADLLVATDGGMVVGYAALLAGGAEAELANLAVSAGCRKRGVGEALLGHARQMLLRRGLRHVYLAVRPSNEGAIRLYERFGFRDIGTHRSYYREPAEDARILALALSGRP